MPLRLKVNRDVEFLKVRRGQRIVVQPLAHVAPQFSIPDQKMDRQAILLQRFRGHNSAVTAIVVTADTGTLVYFFPFSALCLPLFRPVMLSSVHLPLLAMQQSIVEFLLGIMIEVSSKSKKQEALAGQIMQEVLIDMKLDSGPFRLILTCSTLVAHRFTPLVNACIHEHMLTRTWCGISYNLILLCHAIIPT